MGKSFKILLFDLKMSIHFQVSQNTKFCEKKMN